MAITTATMSDLIVMDKNYLDRLNIRKQIIRDHRPIAISALPRVKAAVDELYTYLLGYHLPTRFPRMFKLMNDEKHHSQLLNMVTNEYLPLQPPADPEKTLQLLGENLDEDLLFLLPSEDGDGYVLYGYVTCFPSGFNTKEKLGLKLRDIHGPVPGYKAKLEKSMDRFFDKLEVGNIVMRTNWSVTTHDRLYAASGNHLYDGEEVVEEEIDFNNTYVRCERQMLHRLPKTKALLFNFKTYLYPLKDIKDEGLGEELAQAIDGLKEGSVPGMHFYKRGVVWGEAVKQYLRS
ncbi:hypothetical protein DH86_00000932 [Scytalidium sp. 3C]|nr:hypothetical protein DH86_00000932 [Scytalidium sp. 3C]